MRREYALCPRTTVAGARRAAWDRALADAQPRLSELAPLFDRLTGEDGSDAAAWYNLGLTRAWLGDDRSALAALHRYLELDPSDEQAAARGALMEVLRFGVGMAEQSDYQEWSFTAPLRGPTAAPRSARPVAKERPAALAPVPDKNGLFGLILDTNPAGVITAGRPASETARLTAYLAIAQDMLRVWSLNKAGVERLREELRPRLRLAAGDAQARSGPALSSSRRRGPVLSHRGGCRPDGGKAPRAKSEVLRGEVDPSAAPRPVGQHSPGGSPAHGAAPQARGA